MGEEGGWEKWRVRKWDSTLRPEEDLKPQQEQSEGNHRQQEKKFSKGSERHFCVSKRALD